MAAVILILGLCALGAYTGAWGFYVAAVVGGGVYALLLLALSAAAASVKDAVEKGNVNLRNRGRNN